MKVTVLAAIVATGIGLSFAAPASALGPVQGDGLAPAAPVTQASAARERRLYMMNSIIAQQNRAARYGYGGYGHRHGGYGYRPRGYGYGYGPRPHRHHHHW